MRSVCGTQGERGLHSVPSKLQLGTFLGARYEWYLQGRLVGSTQLVRPLWDCLPMGALIWVVLCNAPLRSALDDGCPKGQGGSQVQRVIDQRMDRWILQGKAVVS